MALTSTRNRRIALLRRDLSSLYTVMPNGCWQSNRHIGKNGYGQISISNKRIPLHVFIYESLVGSIPAGKELDHKCRNKACCNPEHIECVTHTINVQRGDRAILNADSVLKIRSNVYQGNTSDVARELGVCRRTVYDVLVRRTWRNI